MKTILSLLLLIGSFESHASGPVTESVLEYKQGDTVLEGFVARPATKDLKRRPAIVIVHAWMGITDYEKTRAKQIASELGYVAFAADIYGKATRPKNQEEAAQFAGKYRDGDRKLLRERINAAIAEAKKRRDVDPTKVIVAGYCFGGTAALEAGRSGADVAGIVSFHGGLNTKSPDDAKKIKGKVLALHGGDDPYVPVSEVQAFEDEMRKAGVDWQLISYGGAVHSFTHFDQPMKPGAGAGYNEKADKRSWIAFKNFTEEVFNR